MSTPTPETWEQVRQSVRNYLQSKMGSDVQATPMAERPDGDWIKGDVLGRADDLANSVMARLLERAARGEKFRSLEAAGIEESKYIQRGYWRDRKAEADGLKEYFAIKRPSRGRRVAGSDGPVRLPNSAGRGRPTRSSPRRRGPVTVLFPDGTKLVLKQAKDQATYKSSSRIGEPVAFVFALVAYDSELPDPNDELRFLRRELDRARWREAEWAIRAPRRGKR